MCVESITAGEGLATSPYACIVLYMPDMCCSVWHVAWLLDHRLEVTEQRVVACTGGPAGEEVAALAGLVLQLAADRVSQVEAARGLQLLAVRSRGTRVPPLQQVLCLHFSPCCGQTSQMCRSKRHRQSAVLRLGLNTPKSHYCSRRSAFSPYFVEVRPTRCCSHSNNHVFGTWPS